MLIIFTAVMLEAQPIAKTLGLKRQSSTHWANDRIHLHVAGIKAAHLSDAMIRPQTQGIILAGLAGALDPTLSIGDVLLDATSTALRASLPCRVGRIHTATQIIATPQAKATLFQQTAAQAVEMEAATVRQFAAQHQLPFLHVRAISDTATESLNPAVLKLVDSLGRPKPLAIAAALLKNPMLIPTLTQLRRNTLCATANLSRTLASILSTPWPNSV